MKKRQMPDETFDTIPNRGMIFSDTFEVSVTTGQRSPLTVPKILHNATVNHSHQMQQTQIIKYNTNYHTTIVLAEKNFCN